MKTRNQLNSKSGTEKRNHAAAAKPDNDPTNETPTQALSSLRPRDRSSASAGGKSHPTPPATPNQSPSPTAGPKRSSVGPTRVLPRRSCGRPTSLLAGAQQNPTNCMPSKPSTPDAKSDSGQEGSPAKKVFNLLLGVTGSVAAIKLVELVKKLKSMFPRPFAQNSEPIPVEASIRIRIMLTENSKHFVPMEKLIETLNDPSIDIYSDSDEWNLWTKMNDPVLHIELRKWADLCLIAPLDANTMAKIANGICDNLLTCVVRAWDVSKPLVFCPAMNVHMYNHPLTKEQLGKLQSFGYLRVDCIEKKLACGDIGMGGMATVDFISSKVIDSLFKPLPKNLNLPKPILHQQPIYPIISTSANHNGLSKAGAISNQILNRFRTNNQITIHAVPNTASSQPSFSFMTTNGHALKRSRGSNLDDTEDCFLNNVRGQNRPYTIHHLSCDSNNKMGGVTSVQNMRAIGVNGVSSDVNADTGYNMIEDDPGYDFDPSKLLEQTMITDDIEHEQRNSSNTNPSHSLGHNSNLQGDNNVAKLCGLSPLFNTSKFLTSCHNKERGCFTCTICKHDYKNRKSMARHLKEQHVQGKIYQCKPCGVSYKRREKLIKHNRERHPWVQ